MKYCFRNYRITRTCTKNYSDYHRYKENLRQDFQHRCAYCNLLDSQVTTPFEIDHFIPKKEFEDQWPELLTLYSNLVYSCKKCNLAKSNQYAGDLSKREIINDFFYDPVQTDYGEVFYRDEFGRICSDDKKGRDMINRLELYRPIHNFAWLCELAKSALDKLTDKINSLQNDSDQKQCLEEAKKELSEYYITCYAVFIANYNNNKFRIYEME